MACRFTGGRSERPIVRPGAVLRDPATGDPSGHRPCRPMVISSSPQPLPPPSLLLYLRNQLGLSDSALELGIRQSQQEQAPLAVVLWRYGLISLEQYTQLLDWQDARL